MAEDDGTVQFETKVPGRVPNSYALYTKVVDESGNTIKYTKTRALRSAHQSSGCR